MGSVNALKLLSSSTENKVSLFCDTFNEVFANTKVEVTETLENLDTNLLNELRFCMFNKLVELFPHYKEAVLIGRRNKALLAEDIYVMGYSVKNKLRDKGM